MADGANPIRRSGHKSTHGLGLPAAARLLDFLEAPFEVTVQSRDLPRIPGYIIDGAIGGGSGGVVYRAVREGSDRPVALKILNLPLGDPAHSKAAQRAWRELGVLSDLHLP